MLSIFPRNDLFFDLFSRTDSNMHRASQLMLELCRSVEKRAELIGAIREVEHKGDRLTREVIQLLARSFITPLEAEDIHALISNIDDVVDYIDDASSCFVTLHVGDQRPPVEYVRQAELLEEATRLLAEVVSYISKPKII